MPECVCVWVCRYYKEDLAMMKPGQPMPDKWRLFFKFFCYFKPQNVPSDSIESMFLYEQVREIITVPINLCAFVTFRVVLRSCVVL